MGIDTVINEMSIGEKKLSLPGRGPWRETHKNP